MIKKTSKSLLFILLATLGTPSCGSEEVNSDFMDANSESVSIDTVSNLPWGFTPLDCEHNKKDDVVRELPIEVSLDADYSDYFIVIDGTQFVLNGSKFSHKEYVIYGDNLCLEGEFSDPNNSEKDAFKIVIKLNDSTYTYKLKIDDGLGSIRYDTLIPLTNWGIENKADGNLASN